MICEIARPVDAGRSCGTLKRCHKQILLFEKWNVLRVKGCGLLTDSLTLSAERAAEALNVKRKRQLIQANSPLNAVPLRRGLHDIQLENLILVQNER